MLKMVDVNLDAQNLEWDSPQILATRLCSSASEVQGPTIAAFRNLGLRFYIRELTQATLFVSTDVRLPRGTGLKLCLSRFVVIFNTYDKT